MDGLLADLSLTKAIAALLFLIGSGGATTLIAAWMGWKQKRQEREDAHKPITAPQLVDRATIERMIGQQERLITQQERLSLLIEQALDKFDMYLMVQASRKN